MTVRGGPPAGQIAPAGRLLVTGSILVDLTLRVRTLPPAGSDTLTHGSDLAVGGGFNVLTAAHRQGMPTVYLGTVGRGPFGDMVCAALEGVGAERPLPRSTAGDTGICVVVVDATAERTMLTSAGVEGHLALDDLERFPVNTDDTIYLSGYDLVSPHGRAVVEWVQDLDPRATVILDPGPLVGEIDPTLLDSVLQRCHWVSLNAAEAHVMSGRSSPIPAATCMLAQTAILRGVVVRDGERGCVVAQRGLAYRSVPSFPTDAIDTTGAGDCHVGAFAAALAAGKSVLDSAVWANAAASISVSRHGPATAPTARETAARASVRAAPLG